MRLCPVAASKKTGLGSIMGFLCQLAAPAGTASSSVLIEQIGITKTLAILGGVTMLATPLFYADQR